MFLQLATKRVGPTVALLLGLAFLLQGGGTCRDPQRPPNQAAPPHSLASHGWPAAEDTRLVVPGYRIGPLRLGDSREHAMELFPRKPNIDEEYEYANYSRCGTQYHWLDLAPPGQDIFIQFRDGRVFQITATDLRHYTREGLKVNSRPDDVRRYYKNLSAYVLFGTGSVANGDRPFVYWVDRQKGVAFEFYYNRDLQGRRLGGIIVFEPNGSFCPDGATTEPPNWQELAPYRLEPPREMELRWKEGGYRAWTCLPGNTPD